MTMKFGLLGAKLGHSLSPQIHTELYKILQLDAAYGLIEVPAEQLAAKVASLRQDYTGLNVTIPHKVAVMQYLDSISPEAKAIGAVNTIHIKDGKAAGHNTDYFGFSRLLTRNGLDPAGKTVIVLGTGGASRAVLQCLSDRGAHHIILITRDVTQAPADLRAKFAGPLAPKVHAYAEKLHTDGNRSGKLVLKSMCTYQELPHLQADLLVNCTPVGMAPKTGVSPVSAAVIANCGAVVDVIYNPAETELLRLAKLQGKPAVNGLYMLVAQAVAAEEIWLERRLDEKLIDKLLAQVAQLL